MTITRIATERLTYVAAPYGSETLIFVKRRAPLTEDDFTFEVRAPVGLTHETSRRVEGYATARLRDTVAEELKPILPIAGYSRPEPQTTWTHCVAHDLNYTGCRSEAAKAKRVEDAVAAVRDEMSNEHALRETLVAKANATLAEKSAALSEAFTREVVRRYTESVEDKWIAEQDTEFSVVASGLTALHEQHRELGKRIAELEAKQNARRNAIMLAYFSKPRAEKDDADGELPLDVVDKIKEVFAKGEGFKERGRRSPFY